MHVTFNFPTSKQLELELLIHKPSGFGEISAAKLSDEVMQTLVHMYIVFRSSNLFFKEKHRKITPLKVVCVHQSG